MTQIAIDKQLPETSAPGEVLVRVEGVSKRFCRDLKKSLWYGVKDVVSELVPVGQSSDELRPGEFWANREISFEVRRGECWGLLGRNGAGKTTLLKILNGLLKPDTGRIEMHGRVGALIALGAGFNPVLTGRENIYVNGSILGLSKREIDDKLEEIIDFSEIRDFIDAPVQSYSSGMQVRLGFAVATALKPDVLILDEVLAVGDFVFRMKCYKKIASMLKDTAVLFVSHQMDQVRRICSHGLYLKGGNVICSGSLHEAIAEYEADSQGFGSPSNYLDPTVQEAEIILEGNEFTFMKGCRIGLRCKASVDYQNLIVRILFTSPSGEVAGEWHSLNHSKQYSLGENESKVLEVDIPSLAICPGVYQISFILAPYHSKFNLVHISVEKPIRVVGPEGLWNLRQL